MTMAATHAMAMASRVAATVVVVATVAAAAATDPGFAPARRRLRPAPNFCADRLPARLNREKAQ